MRARVIAAAIGLLALSACGQPASEDAPATTGQASVVLTYDLAAFVANGAASVQASPNGAQITTDPRPGAFSAILDLGEAAKGEGLMLRVRAQVERGGFNVHSFHRDFGPQDQDHAQFIAAGEVTNVDLPVDRVGAPILIIANGSEEGASSGAVLSVELVRGAVSP